MSTPDSKLKDAIAAKEAGRLEESLQLLASLFGDIVSAVPGAAELYPYMMFIWQQLAAQSPDALLTLAALRDYHAQAVLRGDMVLGGGPRPLSRFAFVVEVDQLRKNSRGTHSVFKQLIAAHPEAARREAHLALPAVVEMGDYMLADQYLGDPRVGLEELNGMSVLYQLFPVDKPPRLAAELSNFLKDIMLRAAVLRGLDRAADADALIDKVKKGIVARDMRELAERELAAPGTIFKELADLQEAHHAKRAMN